MQLSFRLDKRPGETHLALVGKNSILRILRFLGAGDMLNCSICLMPVFGVGNV